MREIELTRGFFAKVDDLDYDTLNEFSWYAHSAGKLIYARALICGKHIYMHRRIAETPSCFVTDHIDGDTLNNQRANLRSASRAQNGRNRPAAMGRSFKGVFPQVGGFMARIVVDRRPIYLGYFKSQEDAARAYDTAAVKEFGEFAKLNFPEGNAAGLIAAL